MAKRSASSSPPATLSRTTCACERRRLPGPEHDDRRSRNGLDAVEHPAEGGLELRARLGGVLGPKRSNVPSLQDNTECARHDSNVRPAA